MKTTIEKSCVICNSLSRNVESSIAARHFYEFIIAGMLLAISFITWLLLANVLDYLININFLSDMEYVHKSIWLLVITFLVMRTLVYTNWYGKLNIIKKYKYQVGNVKFHETIYNKFISENCPKLNPTDATYTTSDKGN